MALGYAISLPRVIVNDQWEVFKAILQGQKQPPVLGIAFRHDSDWFAKLTSKFLQERTLMSKSERFANATGAPVPDNTNILTVGRRGPALLQDIWLIEKLAHFDREVIPERRVHAKGWGRMELSRPRTTLQGIRRQPFFRK
jgi:hypothetical protein